ncbi:hypothetical protein Tco_0797250 [Tanacetum coccineum]
MGGVSCWTARKRVGPLPSSLISMEAMHTSFIQTTTITSHLLLSSFSDLRQSFFGFGCTRLGSFGSSTREYHLRLGYSREHHEDIHLRGPLIHFTILLGPSRKGVVDPVDSVLSRPVMDHSSYLPCDLLPHHKCFRDSFSYEASLRGGIRDCSYETKIVRELGIGDWKIEVERDDSSDSSGTRDGIVRSFEDMPIDCGGLLCVTDFYHHMSEVRIDRIVGIETVQRRLEAD